MEQYQNEPEVQVSPAFSQDFARPVHADSETHAVAEQSSIVQLVEDHHASLYRFAFRLSGSQSEAEDLTQETYLIAHTKLEQLRDKSSAQGWLFSILRNLFLKQIRKQRKEVTYIVEEPLAVAETFSDEPEIPSDHLQAAIQELPEDFRTPLILFYFEEQSYKQIASFLDVPIGTIMSRLARAKSHLRNRLSPLQTHTE